MPEIVSMGWPSASSAAVFDPDNERVKAAGAVAA